jgi:perosamine synthetase
MDFKKVTDFIKTLYPQMEMIPLHAPVFRGNEKKYLAECIDSTFVSYVGRFVADFEKETANFTGSKHAIATANGTLALHAALILADVKRDDEVICPALTFVATANAITYCSAIPLFCDSEKETLGINVAVLEEYLHKNTQKNEKGECINKLTGRRIRACVPMHTFGHPVKIDQLVALCEKYNIIVIEDAAESLGSSYKNKHTGTFGKIGVLSYNGNKTITTGGGGMILTDDDTIAKRAKHITTTAKIPHRWEYVHDEIGYNYRLTNVAAAIGLAQMEKINEYLAIKRNTAQLYADFFAANGVHFFTEQENCKVNYWLNCVILKDRQEREAFLEFSNGNGVMTRPIWTLMNKLPMFGNSPKTSLEGAQWLEDRVVNIPSSIR